MIIFLFKHEEEPAQNMKPGAAGEKQMSKAALKNQKKREAKKAAKQAIVFFFLFFTPIKITKYLNVTNMLTELLM